MNEFEKSFINIKENAINYIKKIYKKEDILIASEIMHCNKCKQPLLKKIMFLGKEHLCPVVCKCKKDEQAKEKLKHEIYKKRISNITDKHINTTFDNPKIELTAHMDYAKKYVEEWDKVNNINAGLMFLGKVGIGKTVCLYCIANALIDKNVNVKITTLPKVINQIKENFNDINNIITKLVTADCLIIDDFGVEAESDFNYEKIYELINRRYKQNKPLIISTNLTHDELLDPKTVKQARIYNRLTEMCVAINVKNENYREKKGLKKQELLNKILGV